MPYHHQDRDYTTVLQEDREAVVLADQLGFREVWVGEHFTARPEGITSPLIFLATLMEQAKRINFGSAVLCLPHFHPAMIAAYVAMFDHLCRGRFLFGIGTGATPSDLELFKLEDPDARPAMMVEAIDTILKLWSSEPPYDLKPKYWPEISIREALWPERGMGYIPKPYQKPHPPIAISVRSEGSGSARMAGERGWIIISANNIHARFLKSHWTAYQEGCARIGRRPNPANWRVARSVLVTPTDAEAESYMSDAGGMMAYYCGFFLDVGRMRNITYLLKGDPNQSDASLNEVGIAKDLAIYGSPKTVLDKLVALRDAIGPFGTLVAIGHDWDRKAMWQGSMRLLVEEVMPRLRQHAAATRAAG